MGFLNPGLAWFALGGAIPVIIHLLHRQRFRRVRWAAMEFLLAALKKTQRRLRLENLILLLLRILIMVLLALAIAKPFFEEPPIAALAQTNTHLVLAIDNSYSMGFKKAQLTALDLAKKAADDLLAERRTTEDDTFSLLLMSEYPEALIAPTNKKDRAREAVVGNPAKGVPGIELSHYGSNLLRTLQAVQEILDRSTNFQKEVILITDLQRTGWEPRTEAEAKKLSETLKALSTRPRTRFLLLDVGSPGADNHAVVSLRVDGDSVVNTRRSTHFAVDLHNFSEASLDSVPVTLLVDDTPVETRNTFLEAGTATTVKFRYDFIEPGPHRVEARVEPDFLALDDARFLSLNVRRSLQALVVDGEPGPGYSGEAFFYTLVLDPAGEGRDFQVESTTAELFTAEGIEKLDFLVLANVRNLDEDKIHRLEQFVENGGGLLVALGDQIDPVSYNQFFWREGTGLLPAKIGDPAGDPQRLNPRRILNARLDHPVFRTFAEQLPAAPYDLIFYQYYRLADDSYPPVSVLARFDDNFRSPLLVEKRLGEGKVILLTTAIDDEWSESIPGRPPYFVIMRNLSEYLASRPHSRLNLPVGDPIRVLLPTSDYSPEFKLRTPDGTELTAPSRRLDRTDKWFLLEYPTQSQDSKGTTLHNEGLAHRGFYTLRKPQAREDEPPLAYFACNLPPADPTPENLLGSESDLRRIEWDEVLKRFPDFQCALIGKKESRSDTVDRSAPPGGIWRFLLFTLFGFLALETVLAWLFGRAKQ